MAEKQTLRKRLVEAAKEVAVSFFWNDPFTLSAALSFYTLFSLAPLVLVFTGLIGWLGAEQFAREEINPVAQPHEYSYLAEQVYTLTGEAGRDIITQIERSGTDLGGGVSLIVGVVMLLFAATAVFVMLQYALNRIWGVEPDPSQGWVWPLIRDRLLSLAMMIAVGFLLLVSLIISAVLAAAQEWIEARFPGSGDLWRWTNLGVSLLIVGVLITLVYRFLPDAKIAWRDTLVGAAITSVLFSVGKFLIGLYLGQTGVGSSYGAAGSLVVLLVWVYWASFVLFLGAQITYVYAKRFGTGFRPQNFAVGHEEAEAKREIGDTARARRHEDS